MASEPVRGRVMERDELRERIAAKLASSTQLRSAALKDTYREVAAEIIDLLPSLPAGGGDGRIASEAREAIRMLGIEEVARRTGRDPFYLDALIAGEEVADPPRAADLALALVRSFVQSPPVSSSAGDEAREALRRELDQARAVSGLALTFIPADRHDDFAERCRVMLGASSPLPGAGDGREERRWILRDMKFKDDTACFITETAARHARGRFSRRYGRSFEVVEQRRTVTDWLDVPASLSGDERTETR